MIDEYAEVFPSSTQANHEGTLKSTHSGIDTVVCNTTSRSPRNVGIDAYPITAKDPPIQSITSIG